MDIHRARFIPYTPSAITALAFSSTTSEKAVNSGRLRLAVGRANGDIEIWNPHGWYQENILRGGRGRSIEGLVWTDKLLSIGYSSSITEWDLTTCKPKHSIPGPSEIWCIAQNGNTIAIGCADGSISTFDGYDFRRVARTKARVLSLAFQDDTIIAGHADGTIRVYGGQTRSMSLGDCLVWSVKYSDGVIMSGDSTGTVCFWDARTYTLVQRIKSHDADVLAVAFTSDAAYSGGMDRKTVKYKKGTKWSKMTHSRQHEHDLKAMAVHRGDGVDVVVTGGLDTNPIVIPGKENHRTLSSLPQQPCLVSAGSIIVSWWDSQVWIWKGIHLWKKMMLQEEHITSVDISQDGTLLVVSTMAKTKLFTLGTDIRKTDEMQGARIAKLSPDRTWLALVGSVIRVVNLNDMSVVKPSLDAGSQINLIAFSENYIASTDLDGNVNTWSIDSWKQNTFPQLPQTPLVLSLQGDRLLVVTAGNQVYEFNVLGGLSTWSRMNPPESFPAEFRLLKDFCKGVIWDVARQRVWLYGVSWLWMFDQGMHDGSVVNNPTHWHTFKYRPILGIVPVHGMDMLDAETNADHPDDTHSRLQVMLVERPLWDVELPDRISGR